LSFASVHDSSLTVVGFSEPAEQSKARGKGPDAKSTPHAKLALIQRSVKLQYQSI
jgi:hypothetical protein